VLTPPPPPREETNSNSFWIGHSADQGGETKDSFRSARAQADAAPPTNAPTPRKWSPHSSSRDATVSDAGATSLQEPKKPERPSSPRRSSLNSPRIPSPGRPPPREVEDSSAFLLTDNAAVNKGGSPRSYAPEPAKEDDKYHRRGSGAPKAAAPVAPLPMHKLADEGARRTSEARRGSAIVKASDMPGGSVSGDFKVFELTAGKVIAL
jgi:hypothetical protein